MHNEVEFVTPKTRLREGANRGKVIGGEVIKLTFVAAASADPKYVRYKSDSGKIYTFERDFAERLLKWGESAERAKAIAEQGGKPQPQPQPETPAASEAKPPKAAAPAKPRSVRGKPQPQPETPAAS